MHISHYKYKTEMKPYFFSIMGKLLGGNSSNILLWVELSLWISAELQWWEQQNAGAQPPALSLRLSALLAVFLAGRPFAETRGAMRVMQAAPCLWSSGCDLTNEANRCHVLKFPYQIICPNWRIRGKWLKPHFCRQSYLQKECSDPSEHFFLKGELSGSSN